MTLRSIGIDDDHRRLSGNRTAHFSRTFIAVLDPFRSSRDTRKPQSRIDRNDLRARGWADLEAELAEISGNLLSKLGQRASLLPG